MNVVNCVYISAITIVYDITEMYGTSRS